MSVSSRSVFTAAFENYLFEVIFIDPPTRENIENSKNLIRQYGSTLAGFIYEPLLQAAGGMRIYDSVMMADLLQTVRQEGIICIADEVMTGFGRTGQFFASQQITTRPDIICLSKGLTGGTMALGVTAASAAIFEGFLSDAREKTLFHGHSFTANPLACTAALASLDLFEKPACLSAIQRISTRHQHFFSKIENRVRVKNLRILGTLLAFEISSGEDGYLNSVGAAITRQAMHAGIYLRPLGNTLYVLPPYCITDTELDKIYTFIDNLTRDD